MQLGLRHYPRHAMSTWAAYILNSDKDRFSGLKQTLDNANLFVNDDYPMSIEEAVKLMENHKTPTNRSDWGGNQYRGQGREEGMAFPQPGNQKKDISGHTCYHSMLSLYSRKDRQKRCSHLASKDKSKAVDQFESETKCACCLIYDDSASYVQV